MKNIFRILFLFLFPLTVFGEDAVHWSYKLVGNNTDKPSIEITAEVEPGFHLYAMDNPPGGSNPLTFYFETKGCKLDGSTVANKAYEVKYDEIFEVDQHLYDGNVTFTQKLIPTNKHFSVEVEIKGQACNDVGCFQVFGSHKFDGNSPVAVGNAEVGQTTEDKETVHEEAEALAEMTDSLQASEPWMTPAANLSGDRKSVV